MGCFDSTSCFPTVVGRSSALRCRATFSGWRRPRCTAFRPTRSDPPPFANSRRPHSRDHMVLLGRRSAEEKVATFLVGWRDRLRQFQGYSKAVPLPMSRQDIADYLGL